MSKCEICGKSTKFGVSVSHSRSHVSGRHNRMVKPNLKKTKVMINNELKRMTICTRCMRTLNKAARQKQ